MRKILLFVCCLCLSFFCFTPFVNCCFPELENGGWCVLVGGEDDPEAGPVYVAARVAPVDDEFIPPCFQSFRNSDSFFMRVQKSKAAGEYVCSVSNSYAFYVVNPCQCHHTPENRIGYFLNDGTNYLCFKQLKGKNCFQVRTLWGEPVIADNCALDGVMVCAAPGSTLCDEADCCWRYVSWDNLKPNIRDILQEQVCHIMGSMPHLQDENSYLGDVIMSSPVY